MAPVEAPEGKLLGLPRYKSLRRPYTPRKASTALFECSDASTGWSTASNRGMMTPEMDR